MSSSATTNITMKLVRTPRQTPLHPPPCCTTAAQWPSDPTSERDRDQRGTLRYAARPASAAPAWGRHHSVPVGARAPRSLARARECPGRTPNYEVVVEFTSLIAAFIVESRAHLGVQSACAKIEFMRTNGNSETRSFPMCSEFSEVPS